MLFLFIKFICLIKFSHYTVNSCPNKARSLGIIQNLLVFTLFSTNNRSENLHFSAVFPAHNGVNNLVYTLLTDFAATVWTVGMTAACIKKSVKIIYFSDCAHSRTRIFICRFLFNRNSRRQTFYQINIRLIHTSKKLTCIA